MSKRTKVEFKMTGKRFVKLTTELFAGAEVRDLDPVQLLYFMEAVGVEIRKAGDVRGEAKFKHEVKR